MRKLAIVVAVTMAMGSSVYAAGTVRDNCGCGLGTMALGDQNPTILVQLSATFLNGICGNQTFGISSGTLDCEPADGLASNRVLQEYVSDNMDQLAMNMAAGQGDSLDALADLMAIDTPERPQLFTKLQSHFDTIFNSEDVTATEVLENIEAVL